MNYYFNIKYLNMNLEKEKLEKDTPKFPKRLNLNSTHRELLKEFFEENKKEILSDLVEVLRGRR